LVSWQKNLSKAQVSGSNYVPGSDRAADRRIIDTQPKHLMRDHTPTHRYLREQAGTISTLDGRQTRQIPW